MEIIDQIKASIRAKESLLNQVDVIQRIADFLTETLKRGGKILIAGNGGSAADAQHFASEILGRFKMERKALPAIALTTDTSVLTAIGNDYSFDRIFSRQVEGLGKQGDIFIGISTSGNSLNVIEALKKAKELGLKTVGFTGRDGGKMKELCDILLRVDSDNTPRIQESHIAVIHILCELVENSLFKNNEGETN